MVGGKKGVQREVQGQTEAEGGAGKKGGRQDRKRAAPTSPGIGAVQC